MIKNIHRWSFYIILSALALIANPFRALALDVGDINNINIPVATTQQTGANVLRGVAVTVINLILLIAGILAIIYLIIAGVTYITAGGDTAKADKGRAGVVNAIIGLVIISAAYIIVRFVGGAIEAGGTSTSTGPIW